jgi:hypothetical protein
VANELLKNSCVKDDSCEILQSFVLCIAIYFLFFHV